MDSTNSYQLMQEDGDYIFSITLLEESIKLTCEDSKGQIYSKTYSLEEIKSLDQYFANIQSNFDVIDTFDNILKNEKVRVEIESGVLQIILFILSEDRKIPINLDKEGGESNIQEKEEYTGLQQTSEYQMENAELNQPTNYLENNTENIEANANADVNVNVESNLNMNAETTNVEFAQNEIPQTQSQTQTQTQTETNIEEYKPATTTEQGELFDLEEYLKTHQAEINANENVENNVNFNFENNYNVEANNEFNNINIDTTNEFSSFKTENIQANIPQTFENQANLESYTQTTTTTNIYTEPKKEEINYTLPYITPSDEQPKVQVPNQTFINQDKNIFTSATQNNVTSTFEQTTTYNFNAPVESKRKSYHEFSLSLPKDKKSEEDERRINKLKGEQDALKNQNALINSKIGELTNLLNSYKTQISNKSSEINALNALRAENMRIKSQLNEIERLKKEVSEARYLKSQLAQLEPLRQKAAQVDSMKSQLSEINNLKRRVAQLSGIKNQFDEINQLKAELDKFNHNQQYLDELNKLKEEISKKEKITKTQVTKRTVKGDIIHDLDELEMITRRINKSNNTIKLNLLYKASVDSDSAEAFHRNCDKAESSLVLVETDKGKRFGGFTSQNWRGDCQEKIDENAFIFSLDKMKTYGSIEGEYAIGCYPNFGPIFLGCQIRIYDNAFAKGGTTFEAGMNYETDEDYELTGGDRTFGVKDIEVYEIIVE